MVLNLLRIRNLRWNLRRRSPFIRVNLLQDLHALHAQNLFGGHVLASTLEQIKWCVWYHRISAKTTWLSYINLASHFLLNSTYHLFVPWIRWSAQITHYFPAKTCAEILYLVVITFAQKLVTPSRIKRCHQSGKQEVSLVRSVNFLAKRCY